MISDDYAMMPINHIAAMIIIASVFYRNQLLSITSITSPRKSKIKKILDLPEIAIYKTNGHRKILIGLCTIGQKIMMA